MVSPPQPNGSIYRLQLDWWVEVRDQGVLVLGGSRVYPHSLHLDGTPDILQHFLGLTLHVHPRGSSRGSIVPHGPRGNI